MSEVRLLSGVPACVDSIEAIMHHTEIPGFPGIFFFIPILFRKLGFYYKNVHGIIEMLVSIIVRLFYAIDNRTL